MNLSDGYDMYNLAKELFPICRSIMGKGTRQTLKRLQQEMPGMKIFNIPTGTKVFDWTVPKEWNIEDAYVEDKYGNRIIDFQENNLHIVGYSIPVDTTITLEELQNHLYSMPEYPEWIPYVTSYYKERWGFCISEKQRQQLKEGMYHVVIKSSLTDGNLSYGELLIPGESEKEIFLSSYVCHPSMANNELSGPVVLAKLAQWILSQSHHYSYRLILIPETIGSISYLSKNLDQMKKNIIAGYNLSCVGDNNAVSYIPSRKGDTLADRALLNVLHFEAPEFISYSFLDRGSDERQYNSPGVALPVCCLCRSKYGEFPEYHTSADDMNYISPEGLQGSFDLYKKTIESIENNIKWQAKYPCEPQLGPRGLYPTESYNGSADAVQNMMNFLAYADGTHDLIEISNIINAPTSELIKIAKKLEKADLIKPAFYD